MGKGACRKHCMMVYNVDACADDLMKFYIIIVLE